jgi:ribosomal protein S18 acetylase RimI-like enzyme
MHIRTAAGDDVSKIVQLYKEVAKIKGGIARLENEITEEYVENFVKKSIAEGLILVAIHPEDPERFIGEMHAYKPGMHIFKHILSDLTIAVHPEFQGKKIGRTLFTIFLEEIVRNRPDVGRVELLTREGNLKAINFYQSLGFRIEGRMEMRVKTPAGNYEADIPMGWQNPNFEF